MQDLTRHVRDAGRALREGHAIGPAGIVVRVGVGVALIALELFWRDPSWQDAALGLLVMPALITGGLGLRARRRPAFLRATGPLGHALNAAVFVPLLLVPATAGAALLFYGSSMLVAAVRCSGGCEITAISNALLGRRDQVGCVLFAPVDALEAGRGDKPRARDSRAPGRR